MNPRNSELVLNPGGFHQCVHWFVDRTIQMSGAAYLARLFIGFLSESERESLLNPLQRTVIEAKKAEANNSAVDPWGQVSVRLGYKDHRDDPLSTSTVLVERNVEQGLIAESLLRSAQVECLPSSGTSVWMSPVLMVFRLFGNQWNHAL